MKQTSRRSKTRFTAATAEEPTPTDFSAPYSLLMCVLWYAFLKHGGIRLSDPQDWTVSNSPGAAMFLEVSNEEVLWSLQASGPAFIGLKGWKHKDDFYIKREVLMRHVCLAVKGNKLWKVVVLEFLWANVTSCPNELTGGCDKSNRYWSTGIVCWQGAEPSSQWRIVCFKSTSCCFCQFSTEGLLRVKNECAAASS